MAYSTTNMRNVSTIALSALIVAVSLTYLVGQRLEARWAGGDGQIEPCRATSLSDDSVISRGEVMSSANVFTQFELCDGTLLYLDINTEIRLSQYRNPAQTLETQLELIQGRVIVDGVADVRARNTTIELRGAGCEFVHYSWKDELDVTPLAEQACKIKNSPEAPEAFQTSRYHTFDSSLLTSTTFSPDTSSAQAFYDWTELQLEALR